MARPLSVSSKHTVISLLVYNSPCDLPVGEVKQKVQTPHATTAEFLVGHVSLRANLREEGRRQR